MHYLKSLDIYYVHLPLSHAGEYIHNNIFTCTFLDFWKMVSLHIRLGMSFSPPLHPCPSFFISQRFSVYFITGFGNAFFFLNVRVQDISLILNTWMFMKTYITEYVLCMCLNSLCMWKSCSMPMSNCPQRRRDCTGHQNEVETRSNWTFFKWYYPTFSTKIM